MTAPDCPSAEVCPVPSPSDRDLRLVRTVTWPAGTLLWSTYRSAHHPDLFNQSRVGDARFSPLAAAEDGVPPVLYVARTATVSLLETAFHDVHDFYPRRISVPVDLAPRGLLQVRTPSSLTLIDLRDEALAQLQLTREEIVATTAAHYACTRQWAQRLALRRVGRAQGSGIVWRSRVAELAQHDHPILDDLLSGETAEVAMVVGMPHSPVVTGLGQWHPPDTDLRHHPELDHGTGRALVEHIATTYLGATIVDV